MGLIAIQERRLRSAFGCALWAKTSTQRLPGLMFTLMVRGHCIDPAQFPHVRRLLIMKRLILDNLALAERISEAWDAG